MKLDALKQAVEDIAVREPDLDEAKAKKTVEPEDDGTKAPPEGSTTTDLTGSNPESCVVQKAAWDGPTRAYWVAFAQTYKQAHGDIAKRTAYTGGGALAGAGTGAFLAGVPGHMINPKAGKLAGQLGAMLGALGGGAAGLKASTPPPKPTFRDKIRGVFGKESGDAYIAGFEALCAKRGIDAEKVAGPVALSKVIKAVLGTGVVSGGTGYAAGQVHGREAKQKKMRNSLFKTLGIGDK